MPKVHASFQGAKGSLLTDAQRSVLDYAEQRQAGDPWTADPAVTGECCDLGLLEAGTIRGMEPGSPNSTAYDLTRKGREAVTGQREA